MQRLFGEAAFKRFRVEPSLQTESVQQILDSDSLNVSIQSDEYTGADSKIPLNDFKLFKAFWFPLSLSLSLHKKERRIKSEISVNL